MKKVACSQFHNLFSEFEAKFSNNFLTANFIELQPTASNFNELHST